MSNPESEFTLFDEMVLAGDLQDVQMRGELTALLHTLKAQFAEAEEMGLEEEEEPEED